MTTGTDNFVSALTQGLSDLQTTLESYTSDSSQMNIQNKQKLDNLVQQIMDNINKTASTKNAVIQELTTIGESHCSNYNTIINTKSENIKNILEEFATCVVTCLQKAEQHDLKSKMTGFLQEWRLNTTSNISQLHNIHWSLDKSVRQAAERLVLAARNQRDDRRGVYQKLICDMEQKIAAILEEKQQTERHLSQQLSNIQKEKEEFEARLNTWAEQERKLLEERIKYHIADERNFLEEKIKRRIQELEVQRSSFESKLAKDMEWLKNLMCINENEKKKMEDDLVGVEKELEECNCEWNSFADKYKLSINDIANNIEYLDNGAVEVVEQVKHNLTTDLQASQAAIQMKSTSLLEESKHEMDNLAMDSNKLIYSLVQNCQRNLDSVVEITSNCSSSTIEEISTLSLNTSTLLSSTQVHANTQTHALMLMQRQSEQFHGALREEVSRLEELELRCLQQQYAQYCPSGSTPVRAEYKYPRMLAATSPHERILARFRAMRQNSNDDDSTLLENDGETRSDTSSGSEDSAVVFVAPSPPPNIIQPAIVKCTSETDIYLRRRQQENGKENHNRYSSKKTSKLPAPASLKKPFAQRNED